MDECKVSETLDNILDKINDMIDYIGDRSSPESDVKVSAAIFTLARSYDMLAQYDETYQDGDFDEV